jgi:GNAT superfamily N-acetyltransferase
VAVLAHRIDLLYQDGTLVALIEMVPKADHLWIENVAVAPGHQGGGLGCALIAHAEAVARASGTPDLRLLTNAALIANLRFYLNRGFAEDHREPFRGGTVVHFRKPLLG